MNFMIQRKLSVTILLLSVLLFSLAGYVKAQDQSVSGKLSITPPGWGTSFIPHTTGNIVLTGFSGNNDGGFLYRIFDGSSYTNLFNIKPNGRVGLGVAEPVGSLDVKGLTYLRASPTFNTEVEQLRFGRFDNDGRYHSIFSNHSGALASNYLQFRIHDNSLGSPYKVQISVMTLYGNGSVGIGTTKVPTEMLEVNGKIKTREVNVTASGWADHVFKSDYKLIPLVELESFIQKNGHLPNIPTEGEVAEKGVNLAEMNVKLLEKVEELTLYLLEFHRKNEEQDQMIQELIKRQNNEK
ncbi:hypothetical protein J2X69_002410 [Algoriphagus sp. 4150]|uniref:hypothetical protein n=1 Tax=Algoriphagus sp. 4150 TaxID=2817756 RepID=UPI002854BC43|nr:hypothetical protein [Algoriphagus sp. 4150]MDR7130063.1 hypothetical protein [Algoriphagus sp. 4150]